MILASASPRRLELLRQIGIAPAVIPADIDESLPSTIDAVDSARQLARQKAEAVAGSIDNSAFSNSTVVLGADTVVELEGQPLGKPAEREEAATMLRSLQGRTHRVHTGLWIAYPGADVDEGFGTTVTTAVTMRRLSPEEIEAYVATGEGADAAGAYAIQGRAASFVTSIAGEYSNVVGLPLAAVVSLLDRAGITVHHRWNQELTDPDVVPTVR